MTPTSPATSSALAAALQERGRVFLKNLAALRMRRAGETVHDLRVAARRLIAAIDLLLPVLPDAGLVKLRRRLKRLLKSLSVLRDLEIQQAALGELAGRFPVLRPLQRELRLQARQALAVAVRRPLRFDGPASALALAMAAESLRAAGGWPHGNAALLESARASHSASYLRLLRARAQVNRGVPATLHRVRVSLKKHRYAAEILRPLRSGVRGKGIRSMSALQQAFGSVQDWVAVERCVTAYARTRGANGAMLPVLEHLQRRRTELIDAALAMLPALDGLWDGEIRKHPQRGRSH